MSLAERLEEAASALPGEADAIRPANGDPMALLQSLSPEAAPKVLGWLLEHGPAEAEELAEVWLQEPAGVAAVEGLDIAGLAKPGRKVLRRLLHRARSSGLEIADPAAKTAEPKVARLPKVETPIDEAYVAPFDPRGARLVYLVESTPTGGARVFEALLDLARGIVDFQVYKAGRSAVRSFVRDVTSRARYGARAAEPAQVRALIARHVAVHPVDRPFPRNFDEWRGKILSGAEGAATPGEAARKTLAPVSDASVDVDALLQKIDAGELGPWPTQERTELEAAAASVREAGEGAEGEALESKLDEAIDAAARSLYGADDLGRCADRLDEMAHVYTIEGEPDLAAAAIRVADELRSAPGESHAFARRATERLLGSLLEELRGGGSAQAAPRE